ncbi:YciI family protein [Micromonospora sp. RP3T]|uniref:YciI family protein n=1 Tax=Micromonospora sp. RP3T TaxID=2135446 RepID=UPI003D718C7A
MAQYMISIYEREAEYATLTPEAWGSVVDAHSAFAKAVADLGGTITGGGVLQPTTTATSIRGGEVTDGPFVEAKEAFGGFYLVEARDLDHALEIAKLTPAPFGGVEVRPLMDVNAGPAQ